MKKSKSFILLLMLGVLLMSSCGVNTTGTEQAKVEKETESYANVQESNAPSQNAPLPSASMQNTSLSNTSTQNTITVEEAKNIALNHANLKTANFVKAELESEDGRLVYEVEFYVDNVEYDYKIDAISGQILSFDNEIESRVYVQTPSETSQNTITAEKAKSIALNHAQVSESSVRKMKVELERENGRLVYQVEFKVNNTEYDYEIDAATGEIVKFEKDID